jgi:hypothetical protein
MDLREVPGGSVLRRWFQAPHEVRNTIGYDRIVTVDAYDAILFIETITPTAYLLTSGPPPVPKQ